MNSEDDEAMNYVSRSHVRGTQRSGEVQTPGKRKAISMGDGGLPTPAETRKRRVVSATSTRLEEDFLNVASPSSTPQATKQNENEKPELWREIKRAMGLEETNLRKETRDKMMGICENYERMHKDAIQGYAVHV